MEIQKYKGKIPKRNKGEMKDKRCPKVILEKIKHYPGKVAQSQILYTV